MTTQRNAITVDLPLADEGLNIHENLYKLGLNECIQSKNLYWRNGIVKRVGLAYYIATEPSAGSSVEGIHRGSVTVSGAITDLVLCYAGGTLWYDSSGTWTAVATGLTSGNQARMTDWNGLCYFANGADLPFSWDFTTPISTTDISGSGHPTKAKQFLGYRDRLLYIGDVTYPGGVGWSASFDTAGTWQTPANTGVRPDQMIYGMMLHSSENANIGTDAKVLLAGHNRMYLLSGTDLDVTTGNYRVDTLATPSGCKSPLTMVTTPYGSFWLGMDKEVYFLPFKASTPIPVGTKIYSTTAIHKGLESIQDLTIACATYHDGFYKLSVNIDSSVNDTQFWLDVKRLKKNPQQNLFGPWYGPMTGANIAQFDQKGDATLICSSGEFVADASTNGTYGDLGAKIQCSYETPYALLTADQKSGKGLINWIRLVELSLLNVKDDVLFGINDPYEALTDLFDLGGTSNYFMDEDFGAAYFNAQASSLSDANATYFSSTEDVYFFDTYFNDRQQMYKKIALDSLVRARQPMFIIQHNSAADTFELYGIKVELLEQSSTFDT